MPADQAPPPPEIHFCTRCGGPVSLRVPAGDSALRHVCEACGNIHYLNPKVVVGTLTEWEGKIMLCRRGIEPRYGLWTLPAGFMEMGETTAQGALRETYEEACARPELIGLFTLINVTHISQIHMLYRARLLTPDFAAGEESLEVRLFEEAEIPWDQIAFRSMAATLRCYFEDRACGQFGFHPIDLPPPEAS
jgi:ADP-ribose pyrophosphatase YjhB (NUDIX family)